MKIIGSKNLEELIGKEIAFIQVAEFAEHITLATKDGSVLVAMQHLDFDFEEYRTRMLSEREVLSFLDSEEYIRNKLADLGIFDLVEYKARKEEEEKKRKEEYQKNKDESERREYERLKAKFE